MDDQTETQVSLDHLLLDPNNYRFQDDPRFQTVRESRFAEEAVQRKALERISNEGINELKASIQHNGFLTFERIIVRPWKQDPEFMVVVEGNRRVAALKALETDDRNGIDVRPDVLELASRVPVLAVSSEDPTVYLSLMGIRHVGGVRQWGSYQSSKLVAEMRDDHQLEFSDIGPRLGMSIREVTRRYRAFKALRQMEQDEEFGEFAERRMYPMFHEAVSQPRLREWLHWDDSQFEFLDEAARHEFYELLAPVGDDDGRNGEPKITTAGEIRELKTILASEDAVEALREPDKTFADALATAKAEELKHSWVKQVGDAKKSLASIPALELAELPPNQLALLKDLGALVERILQSHDQLNA